jgi:hypothetical protein
MANGCRTQNETRRQVAIKEPHWWKICQWILEAWQSISQDMIVKSFKVAVNSNMMYRSEDDLL